MANLSDTEKAGKWVMKIVGQGRQFYPVPMYLVDFDPEYTEPATPNITGIADLTDDPRKAKRFDSLSAVMDYWKTQSKTRPIRLDGRPNRPLTAYMIEPTVLEDK